jgi:hypothetical protein
MVMRAKWPKQIGNDGLTRIAVPASAVPAATLAATNGATNGGHDGDHDGAHNGAVPGAAVAATMAKDLAPSPAAAADTMANTVAAAMTAAVSAAMAATMADTTRTIMALETAIVALRERAERAEQRNTELQAALDLEIAERRRIVAALIEKLPAPDPPRRSWWRWGRG